MSGSSFLWLFCVTTAPAAIVCWALCFLIRRQADNWQWLDRPGGHKSHASPVPLGGGMAIAGSVTLTLLAAYGLLLVSRLPATEATQEWLPTFVLPHLAGVWERAPQVGILIICGLILMGVGLGDDVIGLSWQLRLFVQFAIATVSVLWLGWELTLFIPWPAIAKLVSILWIVALINAFNMLDNMDALSAGVATIAGLVLAIVFLHSSPQTGGPQLFIGGFLLVLTGSLVGFLWHNRPPARLYMGDAGSYFVGYSLAVATLLGSYTNYEGSRPHLVLIPIFVLAVPLYDMSTVITIRLREGRSIFAADNNHFSHRLVRRGMSKPRAVATICGISTVFGVAALLLRHVTSTGAWLIGLLLVAFVLGIAWSERRVDKRHP